VPENIREIIPRDFFQISLCLQAGEGVQQQHGKKETYICAHNGMVFDDG